MRTLHWYEIEHMKWEEHDLDYLVATLGLEDDDLLMMEEEAVEIENDWLDDWMRSLEDNVSPETISKAGPVRGQGDQDFMEWLVAELKEMMVEEEVIGMVVDDQEVVNNPFANLDVISECVMTVSCPGECHGGCSVDINDIFDGITSH